MEPWVARNNRRFKSFPWSKLIVAVLFIFAVMLGVYRFFPQVLAFKTFQNLMPSNNKSLSEDDINKLVGSILAEMRLGNTNIKKQPVDYRQQIVDYVCFSAPWPDVFPNVWFTQRIQNKCRSLGSLSCTATEVKDGEGLIVWLMNSQYGDTLAEIELAASSKTIPDMSSIAFLFDNFADFKSQEALDLIWMDIPFGFILQADQIPGRKLSRALKSSRGQAILEVPYDSAGWDLILSANRLARRIPDKKRSEANLRAILTAFPALGGIFFQKNGEIDRELVHSLMDEAEILRLAYIYQDGENMYADSLAYLKGMKIKRLDNQSDCRGKSAREIRQILLDKANDFSLSDKGIYLLDSRIENVEMIKSLQDVFAKLNIIMAQPLRTAETVENI